MKKPAFSRKELKSLANRLTSLLERGLDKRSKEVRLLIQEIKFLLNRFGVRRRQLRRIFGGAAVCLGIGFTQNINAQATFAAPVINPFGLTSTNYFSSPAKADLDNDGDLDLIVTENHYGGFKYYQNTGTAVAPIYSAPVNNPFGLVKFWAYAPKINLVDLDNDGDFDLLCNLDDVYSYSYSADIVYYENTGTASAPNFASPLFNPFGISNSIFFKCATLIDLDNDGDLDLLSIDENLTPSSSDYSYQENIGTASVPNFGTVQLNPFGLTFPIGITAGMLDYNDIDNDGDLDLLFGEFYGNGNFHYYQNTGSATVPTFAAPLINPFGLTATNASTLPNKANCPILLDMDADGDLDVLSGEFGGDLIYFENISPPSSSLAILNISIGSPSCSPGGDGTITAFSGGGIGPITYKIGADSNINGSFSNYSPGTYTLRLRDSFNTIVDSIITIQVPLPPSFDSLNSVITNTTCNASTDGSIALSATGGKLPYAFALLPVSSSPTTQNIYNNLSANTYSAIITDANNCIDTATIVITQPAPISLSIDSFNNIDCFGFSTGKLYTSATGGSGSFNYSINPASIQTTSGVYLNLSAGNYTITCTDSNQCSATVTQTIAQLPQLVLTVDSINNVSCFGGSDGKIFLTATGGTQPYSFNQPVVGGCLQNLSASVYNISLTDSNGCFTGSNGNVITEPPQLVLSVTSTQNPSSPTALDGNIVSLATGGTPTISYNITPNTGLQAPPGTFSGLGSNTYTITATDSNNCIDTTMTTLVGNAWPVSLNDIEKHNVKVYPNPVTYLIKIESDNEIISLRVLDVAGKIIVDQEQPEETISLKNLPTGIYVLKLVLKNEDTVYTRITKQ